jgi:hypothetical protein
MTQGVHCTRVTGDGIFTSIRPPINKTPSFPNLDNLVSKFVAHLQNPMLREVRDVPTVEEEAPELRLRTGPKRNSSSIWKRLSIGSPFGSGEHLENEILPVLQGQNKVLLEKCK